MHIAAALTYTLLVVLAGLLAKGGMTGDEGLVRVLIASGIMIAPQVGHGAFILLLAPDHTGTGVPVLVAWLLLDRAPRRWWVPPLVGLLLVWVEVGDRLAITIGAPRSPWSAWSAPTRASSSAGSRGASARSSSGWPPPRSSRSA